MSKRVFVLQPMPHPSRRREALCGVYCIRHIDSGKCYVGSSADIDRRWRQHRHLLCAGKHPNQKLQNAWAKYGEEAFEFGVLDVCQETQLVAVEQQHIEGTNCVAEGYNVAALAGRERAGVAHSREAIERMAAAHRGKTITAEARAKLSAAFKGRVFSEETRAKISAAKMGRKRAPFSEQAKANMSAGMKGRVHSPECRAALSAAHTGKVMSSEARANMSIAQRKRFAR